MLGILQRIHLHDFQVHFLFLMHNFIQSYDMIYECYVLQLPHFFYDLCMNVIMNERAHKGFMICYTNMDELTRLYEMLYVHS
jgi:hypothetical protein